jgi:hypothetical protein
MRTCRLVLVRPDIRSPCVRQEGFSTHLAGFNMGEAHWHSAKHVLRYLKSARNRCLTLGINSGDPNEFVGYSNSDWGHDIDCGRSISGYVFLLGDSVISWSSKQQPTVAASATEGEYISHSTRQEPWLCRSIPTTIFIDHRGAIDLWKDSHYLQRAKHIDIRHHLIREHVEDGTVEIIHWPS